MSQPRLELRWTPLLSPAEAWLPLVNTAWYWRIMLTASVFAALFLVPHSAIAIPVRR
jgi:hypothetical protein